MSGRRKSARLKYDDAPESKELEEQDEIDAEPNSSSDSVKEETDYSELERLRLENIRKNEQFFTDLGIDHLKAGIDGGLASKKAATKRGTVTRPKPRITEPVRRSGRVTIEKLRSEIELLEKSEERDEDLIAAKKLEYEDMLEKKNEATFEASYAASAEQYYEERFDNSPIRFAEPINKSEETDEQLWVDQLLQVLHTSDNKSKAKSKGSAKDLNIFEDHQVSMKKLSVDEKDVAKVADSRITACCLHPSTTKLIAIAGDKNGHVGIWDVDSFSGGSDGVFRYRPHVRNVAKIHVWQESPHNIHSVSYDGTIRSTDIDSASFVSSFTAPEDLYDMIYTDAHFSRENGNAVYIAKSIGEVALVDLRASSTTYQWNNSVQEGKINSVQIIPNNTNLLLCASSGMSGYMSIYDIRVTDKKWKPVVDMNGHTKSINAAYASPDGNHIVSVSLDNTIKTWSKFLESKGKVESTTLRHDNHTGRWLSTFHPAFDPKQAATFVVGSMEKPRRIEIFSVNKAGVSSLVNAVKGDYVASVCSRNCFHPSMNIIAAGNSSGRVHILR